ncbi:MAG: helix-turn-helix domain-containing protein [Sphingobacterium sp.]|jgi:AraC-like DNA-binding protein|nr:helix-turn-helix domain-containing protein [Sphingobacterium sp.]
MQHKNSYTEVAHISTLQKKTGIYKNIIYHKAVANELCRFDFPVRTDFFIVILFENGAGIHIIDDTEYQIHKNQAHIIFPEQKHYWNYDSTTIVHQLVISQEWYEAIRIFFQFNETVYKKFPVIPLNTRIFNKLVKECEEIGLLQRNTHLHVIDDNIMFIKSKIIVQIISREIENILNEHGSQMPPAILVNFIILIKKHCQNENSVKFYADRLGVSSNHLNVLCKKHFGKTAKICIQIQLINIIRDEINNLNNSDKTLFEIAIESGFNCYTSFAKCIKKHLGLSPIEFKINMQNSHGDHSLTKNI